MYACFIKRVKWCRWSVHDDDEDDDEYRWVQVTGRWMKRATVSGETDGETSGAHGARPCTPG